MALDIDFYEPPPAQKAGGLDQAIGSLREYLLSEGFGVQTNPHRNIGDRQPEIIHFHGLWQPQFLKVSRRCRRLGIPYVVSPHGMLEPWAWKHKYWKKLPYYYFLERTHLRNAGAVLATSDQEAVNLSRFVPRDKVTTIPLGMTDTHKPGFIAAREKLGWGSDELVFLFLSRLHPKKGLHLLLKALGSVAESLPEKWRLVIVGDGDQKYVSECRASAEANENVFRHTEWKGAVWDETKWIYYQGADLFCLPSFSENFGLAILEACQVGTRVLTTRYTPWGFLADWQAGVMVEPEVESLKQGLMAFLKSKPWNQNDRAHLAGRIRERFHWQKIGRQYVELYQRLAAATTPDVALRHELNPKKSLLEG